MINQEEIELSGSWSRQYEILNQRKQIWNTSWLLINFIHLWFMGITDQPCRTICDLWGEIIFRHTRSRTAILITTFFPSSEANVLYEDLSKDVAPPPSTSLIFVKIQATAGIDWDRGKSILVIPIFFLMVHRFRNLFIFLKLKFSWSFVWVFFSRKI